MKLSSGHHLSYCLNCFNDTTLAQLDERLKKLTFAIRQKLKLSSCFPLAMGLHIPADALESFSVETLKKVLAKHSVYVLTLNAFPYEDFHEKVVKRRVYLPHWGDERRLDYTLKCVDLLAAILPEGMCGVISTLPLGYKNIEKDACELNLKKVNDRLKMLKKRAHKTIFIALEPEPDCLLESMENFPNYGEMVRCCFDTSHAEVVGEKWKVTPLVCKIQFSSALAMSPTVYRSGIPLCFRDDKYLHQTRIGTQRYDDLQLCFEGDSTLISHFHLPLFFDSISDGVWAEKKVFNEVCESIKQGQISTAVVLEIETYTWSILTHFSDEKDVYAGIAHEYEYLLKKINSQPKE